MTPVICHGKEWATWPIDGLSTEEQGHFAFVESGPELTQTLSFWSQVGSAILLTSADSFDAFGLNELGRITPSAYRVLVVTRTQPDDRCVERYIRSGCSGVLSCEDSPEIWQKALRSLEAGEMWASRRITTNILRQMLRSENSLNSHALTPRENQILELIGAGYSNQEIGDRLFITRETVRWHVRAIYSKLGITERDAAIQLWRSTHRNKTLALVTRSGAD